MEPDWRRTPGRGAYARPELERRFLVRRHPAADAPGRLIEDLYLAGTRLRLRRVTVGTDRVHKLTQKVRAAPDDPAAVALTNIYLDADEFDRLAGLPSAPLTKTRRIVPAGDVAFAVDQFHGPLEGLLLAEVEVPALDAPLPEVDWLGREVTHDDRYAGGSLATMAERDVRALLAEPS